MFCGSVKVKIDVKGCFKLLMDFCCQLEDCYGLCDVFVMLVEGNCVCLYLFFVWEEFEEWFVWLVLMDFKCLCF